MRVGILWWLRSVFVGEVDWLNMLCYYDDWYMQYEGGAYQKMSGKREPYKVCRLTYNIVADAWLRCDHRGLA